MKDCSTELTNHPETCQAGNADKARRIVAEHVRAILA